MFYIDVLILMNVKKKMKCFFDQQSKNRIKTAIIVLFITVLFGIIGAYFFSKKTTSKVSAYLNVIKEKPEARKCFFKKMPKGADLHMHIGGTEYAEKFIYYGSKSNFCLNRGSNDVFQSRHCNVRDRFRDILANKYSYNRIIDAWSMRSFKNTSHIDTVAHFFSAFKTDPILNDFYGDVLRDIVVDAANNNVLYVELQTTFDDDKISTISSKIKWNKDFSVLHKQLLNKLQKVITEILRITKNAEERKNKLLFCNTASGGKGCEVLVKWQHVAVRNSNPVDVFAQLLVSFILAKKYPQYFVGINLVGQENSQISMRDYNLHMRIINFLHTVYPDVKISLHAGELTKNDVNAYDLSFHINDAVNVANANRIGHGLDIAYEDRVAFLLDKMAKNSIAVEIAPTSEAVLWGAEKDKNPLMLYFKHEIPVVISTDDAGMFRTDLSTEFEKVFMDYNLSYEDLKSFVRNSVTYSFLPGKSLWQNSKKALLTKECLGVKIEGQYPSDKCAKFLKNSEKASLQWKVERQFTEFEKQYSN